MIKGKKVLWKKINIDEDPSWVEWHSECMSETQGRIMIKVWLSGSGDFMVSFTKPNSERGTSKMEADNIENSKIEALEWAKAQ